MIFHLHQTKSVSELPAPNPAKRRDQIWIWLTDESPFNTFWGSNLTLGRFDGVFNWSLSYRSDSDVPVPYGRVRDRLQRVPFNRTKSRLAAILISNGGGNSGRRGYLDKLSRLMPVDVWGGLSGNESFRCPGHFTRDCPGLNDYKFYLSFENSACSEYITEKVWWNAYRKNSVPVVLGGKSRLDYDNLLPPNSFIHVDDFNTVEELADFIRFLGDHDEFYARFHLWRSRFEVLNEHGYFGSPTRHYCRICEALNYNRNSIAKTYDRIEETFWSVSRDCRKS